MPIYLEIYTRCFEVTWRAVITGGSARRFFKQERQKLPVQLTRQFRIIDSSGSPEVCHQISKNVSNQSQ